MSIRRIVKVVLLVMISVFILQGCSAQVKLDSPKSIISKVNKNIIEIVDIGHYGIYLEEITGINFDNFQNFRADTPLPSNYADTFNIDQYDAGFIDRYIVKVNIPNYPKSGSFLTVNFQPSVSIFETISANMRADQISKNDLELLFSGEYEAFILNSDSSSEYYQTRNYLDVEFSSQTTRSYNEYKQLRPVFEKNFAVIKEWVDEKGWEQDYWYLYKMPDLTFTIFKGIQTESSVSRSVPLNRGN